MALALPSVTEARTPPGLPIPGSSRPGVVLPFPKHLRRNRIIKMVIRRLLPPPAQIILEGMEYLYPGAETEFTTIPAPSGWVHCCTNPAPTVPSITHYFLGAGRCGPGCNLGPCINNQAIVPAGAWNGGNLTTNQCSILFLGLRPNGRYDVMQRIARPGSNVSVPFCATNCNPAQSTEFPTTKSPPFKLPFPADYPIPFEWIWPDLIPEIVPPTAPRLDPPGRLKPAPTTTPRIDPWTNPDYGTVRGPAPSARPVPFSPNPDFDPGVAPSPISVPTPGPSTQPIPIAPGPAPTPSIATRPLVNRSPGVEVRIDPPGWTRQLLRPPGPRVKERKFIVAIPPGAASRIIGGVTEGMDMVDCIHKSMPKSLQAKPKYYRQKDGSWKRSKKVSMKRKAAAIYKNMDNPLNTGMTLFNALTECGYQQAQDRFYAALGRAGGKAGRRLNLSSGFGLGGSVRQSVTGGSTPTGS